MRGNVYKRGNKYYIRYDLPKDSNGKRVQKTESGFNNKRQAEKALRERLTQLENSYANKLELCTLEAFLNDWLNDYCIPRLALNTVNGYRVNIKKHIVPYIGNIPLYKLQNTDITHLYAKLREKKLSETSILYVHRVLHRALSYAVKQRVLPYNVTDFVEAPKKNKFKANVLKADEIITLLSACANTEIYLPVMLAVMLGLRRGEVLGLKWSDIDFKSSCVEIQRTATFTKDGVILSDTKTKSSNRTLLLSKSLINELQKHKEKQKEYSANYGTGYNPQNMVFCRADNTLITASILQKDFKKALSDSNLQNIRFHDLRHSNATLLLRQNIPAKIVSSLLGHSNISITLDTYSHVMTDMQESAVNALDNLIFKDNVIHL